MLRNRLFRSFFGDLRPGLLRDIRRLGGAIAVVFCGHLLLSATALAQTPFQLKDINSGSGSSSFKLIDVVGNTAYFFANDGSGSALWRSDGTPESTVKLMPGLGTSKERVYHVSGVIGGELLFEANGDLWKTNGTTGGTTMLKDLSYIGVSNKISAATVGSLLIFSADGNDGAGLELWKSNGSVAGTVRVKDIRSGSSTSMPYAFTAMGGNAYFQANDGTEGAELWKSNGTEPGTSRVKNIQTRSCITYPDGCNSYPDYLVTVGSTVYFSAKWGSAGRELWKSDGTESGTVQVKDINSLDDSDPLDLIAVGSEVFFSANNGTDGRELWKSDGTDPGTVMVANIRPGDEYSHSMGYGAEEFAVMAGALYFQATSSLDDYELWRSDGTPGGTYKVKDIASGSSTPRYLAVFGSTLYFAAGDATNGREVWKTDGTLANTTRVTDINSGIGDADPFNLGAGTEAVYFGATDGSTGAEPWVLHTDSVDPTDPTTVESSTHTANTWSKNNQITTSWSGAADTGGSGVRGYSVLFDTTSGTTPDTTVDVVHTSDPHQTTSAALADSTSHYFHLRTCDAATNCTSTEHLGPFWIDTAVPTAPTTLVSTSHGINSPSTVTTVAMEWSGATDTGGSGIAGYSILFDSNATSDPGTTVNRVTTSYDQNLGEGSWYFHLRACDNAGNCSATLDRGPYRIDGTGPSNPTSLDSPSHTKQVWSNDSTITFEWSGATDGSGVGVSGYSIVLDQFNSTTPNTTPDVAHIDETSVHTWTTTELTNAANYYFHLRTCDSAGNWSAPLHRGPFYIDLSPPTDPTTVESSSHAVDAWSNVAQVDVNWSGASAAPFGSAVDGYFVRFNTSPTEFGAGDGTWVDHASPSFSETLTEGSNHYFHLRTCDEAGNCTSTEHLGPFKIDLTTPTSQTSFASTSHIEGVWDKEDQIAVEWSGALDFGGSGLAGYSLSCTTSSTSTVDGTIEEAHSMDPHTWTSGSLANGTSWWCHVAACDGAGNCADEGHVGPFSIDRTNPGNPSVVSTSHIVDQWSTSNVIEMGWEGASDALSGLAGYSIEFTQSGSLTIPDTVVDHVQDSDPHSMSSGSLADFPFWYFHLRSCDTAGNCSDPVHKGPYQIDTTPPTSATVSSSSHQVNVWSADTTIDVQWSGVTDPSPGSGIAGYSHEFDQASTTVPDTSLQGSTQSTTSPALVDGSSHWFHLHTRDNAGNWGNAQHLGPFKIDTQPPVLSAATVQSTSHTAGVPSINPEIAMAWVAASDVGSGHTGYFYVFNGSSSSFTCAGTFIDSAQVSVTSPPMSNGSWYFHLCARDAVQNKTPVVTVGPYIVAAAADLQVAASDSPDPVLPGANLTYSVSVTNSGPSTAQGVELKSYLPADVTYVGNTNTTWCSYHSNTDSIYCYVGTLASGETWPVQIVGRVENSATPPLTFQVQASLTGPPEDPIAGNDTATEQTDFPTFGETDLMISGTGAPDPVAPGGTVVITATVYNPGPNWADGVYLYVPLPPLTSIAGSNPGPPDCGPTTGGGGEDGFGCELWTIGASDSKIAELSLNLAPDAMDDSLITQLWLNSDQPDPDMGNNFAQVEVEIGDLPVHQTLMNETLDTSQEVTAQCTITTANVSVSGPGVHVVFRAGSAVVIEPVFTVENGATWEVVIDPSLVPASGCPPP